MLRHIVMWKFRPGTEAERDLFLTGLQGLYGAIPELKRCQVLLGMEGSDYDAVLISEFADQAALEAYKNDPRHKVSPLCANPSGRTGRRWTVCCRIRRNKEKTPEVSFKAAEQTAEHKLKTGRIRQWPFIRKQKPTTPRPTWA